MDHLMDPDSRPVTAQFPVDQMSGSDESATITVRVVKSLQYKNFKNIVLRNVDLHSANLNQLRKMVLERMRALDYLAGNPL